LQVISRLIPVCIHKKFVLIVFLQNRLSGVARKFALTMEIGTLKRKRTISLSDDDVIDDGEMSLLSSGSFELQRRIYDMTVVKLKTAAPLTRSQRRREPPLLRTVLMFNTLRQIEKNCAPGTSLCAGFGLTSLASVDQSSLLRPRAAANRAVEMDVLPSLPSEYFFSCSFDRLDSECFCQSYDPTPRLTPLARTFGSPPDAANVASASTLSVGGVSSSSRASSSSCSELFSSSNVDDLPIITFSSVLEFESSPAATAANKTVSPPIGIESNFDLTFDWPDFDTSPSEATVTELPLSPLPAMDFDGDFDSLINLEMPVHQPPSSSSAACSHSVTCNHRNELFADELEHIVQQILVGT
jgi:hypothetical protein